MRQVLEVMKKEDYLNLSFQPRIRLPQGREGCSPVQTMIIYVGSSVLLGFVAAWFGNVFIRIIVR